MLVAFPLQTVLTTDMICLKSEQATLEVKRIDTVNTKLIKWLNIKLNGTI